MDGSGSTNFVRYILYLVYAMRPQWHKDHGPVNLSSTHQRIRYNRSYNGHLEIFRGHGSSFTAGLNYSTRVSRENFRTLRLISFT